MATDWSEWNEAYLTTIAAASFAETSTLEKKGSDAFDPV
jgi:hypothetical protein